MVDHTTDVPCPSPSPTRKILKPTKPKSKKSPALPTPTQKSAPAPAPAPTPTDQPSEEEDPVPVYEEVMQKYHGLNNEKIYLIQKIAALEGKDELAALVSEVERAENYNNAMKNKVHGLEREARM